MISGAAPVALLTDFGTSDNFVASMKAVLLKKNPGVPIVDITHEIPPQNIRLGAFQLLTCYKTFPSGTLFISVVDPGVGSKRKILYAEAGDYRFIAPDNGILSWIFDETSPETVYDVSDAAGSNVSRTFHGRDVMAPVAGEILSGTPPEKLGKKIKSWERFPFPMVNKTGSKWNGEILAVDAFGNLVTNIKASDVEPLARSSKIRIRADKSTIRGLSKTYSDVPTKKLLALEGSSGFIEISVRDGNAAKTTNLAPGSPISLEFLT